MVLSNGSIKIVRDFLGMTQSSFAKKLKISQPTLSKIEKGEKELTSDQIKQFKMYFNEAFFHNNFERVNPKSFYRKLASINKAMISSFEARLNLLCTAIDKALDIIDIETGLIPNIDANQFNLDFEYIATEVRLNFGIGGEPIDDIVNLLESRGVLIHYFDYPFISSDNKKFDGVSFFIKGVPVILVNKKIPNSRKVFTIAHELGHLVCHFDSIIDIDRDIEKEANDFAAAFLAPADSIKTKLKSLTIDKLEKLKIEWNMSMAALVYRAFTLGNITNQTFRFWMMKLAPYRKSEPNEFILNNPALIYQLFEMTKEETEGLFFKELGFTETLIEELLGIKQTKEKVKLQLVKNYSINKTL